MAVTTGVPTVVKVERLKFKRFQPLTKAVPSDWVVMVFV
jgi:hypothetical protein